MFLSYRKWLKNWSYLSQLLVNFPYCPVINRKASIQNFTETGLLQKSFFRIFLSQLAQTLTLHFLLNI